ncbi:unnamed protein product [Candida verbasci]|uniref:Conserved oligomeric Golgi complex subunit 3 n=1 Tax=Candida verbasci TaxID=1227364 RepID=A0A9W4TUI6_9ASCO|nr:unnamed protein product [Candida verbasci]
MPRGRSKSIVQKIANDVHNNTESHLNLDSPNQHQQDKQFASATTFKHSRSKSQESITKITKDFDNLYPFTNEEEETVWSKFISKYNHDTILKPEDIENVNNYQLDSVLNFKSCLKRNSQALNSMILESDDIIDALTNLLNKYNAISQQTMDFDKEANKLINQQNETNDKYLKIYENLKHFEHLDVITKHLSRSGNHLLNQKREFFKNDILQEIDNSLEFINEHPDFKESELYGSRFRQCMTRALTLIRNYLNSELKSISDTIERKLREDKTITISILIYNEFNNYFKYHENSFNELFNEIVKRVDNHLEYNGLLHDITTTYFNIRIRLINQYVQDTSTINELYNNHTSHPLNLVQTCQDQISYFKNIIEREYQLYIKFFDSADSLQDDLYQFLKNAIDPLYDAIRLLVIKEHNISNLCQLTTLLQKYYEFEDEADGNGSLVDTGSYFDTGNSIKYGILFQPILDGCQNRLIFRIQKYVDDKLIPYNPKASDLKIIGNIKRKDSNTTNVLDVDYEDNLFPDIYLPLGKALTLLSNIYELINSVVFDDLAHYIVHACIELLKGEFLKISIAHLGIIDGKLSYIKNLIILKNQINNFDIQFTRTDYSIDFISGLNDIWQMIKNRQFNYNNGGFIELAKKTVPKIINNMMDANYEIELELNNSVSEFIDYCSNEICEPIIKPTSPSETISKFKDNLIMKIPNYYTRIKIILNDEVVTQFLMNNLSNLIIITYENYYNNLIESSTDLDENAKKELSEIMEIEVLDGFVNDMISNLFVEDEKVQFNESVLEELENELKKEESTKNGDANEGKSPSPGTK